MAIMQHKLITLVIGVKLQQAQQFVTHDWVAVWYSGTVAGCNNEATLCPAWLVLGWVTNSGWENHLSMKSATQVNLLWPFLHG